MQLIEAGAEVNAKVSIHVHVHTSVLFPLSLHTMQRTNCMIHTHMFLQDDDGETPLHCAARGGHMEVVKLLLEKGADVTIRSTSFKTAAEEADDEEDANCMEVKRFLEEQEAVRGGGEEGGADVQIVH